MELDSASRAHPQVTKTWLSAGQKPKPLTSLSLAVFDKAARRWCRKTAAIPKRARPKRQAGTSRTSSRAVQRAGAENSGDSDGGDGGEGPPAQPSSPSSQCASSCGSAASAHLETPGSVAPSASILPFPTTPSPTPIPREGGDTLSFCAGRDFLPEEIAALEAVAGLIGPVILDKDGRQIPIIPAEFPELRAEFFRDVVNARLKFETKWRMRSWREWRKEQREDFDDDTRGFRG
jgi:hypothetical protein